MNCGANFSPLLKSCRSVNENPNYQETRRPANSGKFPAFQITETLKCRNSNLKCLRCKNFLKFLFAKKAIFRHQKLSFQKDHYGRHSLRAIWKKTVN